MEHIVYLDNSSTTKPCEKAVEYMMKAVHECWGNPSSLHRLGIEAELCVTAAREAVAASIGCRADEIIFTGSGTEANNTALIGAAFSRAKRGNRIVTTAIEHPSVLETVKYLEESGFEVVRLKPQKNGKITPEQLADVITPDTILVSMMLVNNETGAIQPVAAAAEAIKKSGAPALLHCDAVQGFGKLPIAVSRLGVDLLTASGHKIHGVKGIGFLYLRKGVTIRPFITGGGQENGMRSGTEAVPCICGLHGAIDSLPNLEKQLKTQRELWFYAKNKLLKTGFCEINSEEDDLPYILNISVPGYRSETLLHFLEQHNIFVSSGSACAKGHGSYVLLAAGIDKNRVDSALRLSFSRCNTHDDIDRLVVSLTDATRRLRKV